MLQTYSVKDITAANSHSKPLTDVKWNCDGNYASTASYDKSVKIHLLESSGSLKTVHSISCTAAPAKVCWHPTNPVRFAIISDDKNLDIWDVRATNVTMKILTLGSNINMSWSPNGKYLAVGNKSDSVIIIEVSTGKQVKKFKSVNGK